jgi:hypothetical protein
MEEIVALLVQFIFEVGLQLLGSLGVDFLTASRSQDEKENAGCGWLVLFAVVGGICGGLSLLAAPHLFLPNLALRIANLIIAPVVAGALSYLVARYVWTSRQLMATHHFWRGFWFALAFGLVRFASAHR